MNVKELTTIVEDQRKEIANLYILLSMTQSNVKVPGTRDYGPNSKRKMTDLDAYNIRFGDHKDLTVNEICDKEGLSRGQVYSVKGMYTFKTIDENFLTQ